MSDVDPVEPVEDPIEKQLKKSERRSALQAWVPVLVLIVALGVVVWSVIDSNNDRAAQSKANSVILKGIADSVKNSEDILSFTDTISSPEAQAENTARTTELIRVFATQLQCDNRDALQDVVDALAAKSYLDPINVKCEP